MDVSAIAEIGVEVPEISTDIKTENVLMLRLTDLSDFFIATKEKCLNFDDSISDNKCGGNAQSKGAIVMRVSLFELRRQHIQIQNVYNSNYL